MKLQDFNSFSFPQDRTEKTSDKIEILCALYIIYFIIHTDARNLLRHGKVGCQAF